MGHLQAPQGPKGLLYEKQDGFLRLWPNPFFPAVLAAASVLCNGRYAKIRGLNFMLSKWRMRWWQQGIVVHICLATVDHRMGLLPLNSNKSIEMESEEMHLFPPRTVFLLKSNVTTVAEPRIVPRLYHMGGSQSILR